MGARLANGFPACERVDVGICEDEAAYQDFYTRMATIEFVRNYSDLSTDRGYQFEFRCDHCGSGFMSSYQPSYLGSAGGLLEAAGSIFGGILGSAGNSAYNIQRAIGGPAHDRALQQAVTEVKQKFRRCQRCGKWVCADVCWNERALQCTSCTPKFEQEVISLRTQAQVQATQDQLREKAAGTDYVSGIDMNPDAQVRFNPPQATLNPSGPGTGTFLPLPPQDASMPTFLPPQTGAEQPMAPAIQSSAAPAALANCSACGATVHGSKFCPECGTKVLTPQTCKDCGHISSPTARFCPECGVKLS